MKVVRKRFRYEWTLLASSVLFFLMSRFIIPRYEEMVNMVEGTDDRFWSSVFFVFSLILLIAFLVRVIWLIRQKNES